MTALRNLFCGEEIRRQLEGATADQILRIMGETREDEDQSPFAQVLGFHLLAEPQVATKGSGYRKKKGKVHRQGVGSNR